MTPPPAGARQPRKQGRKPSRPPNLQRRSQLAGEAAAAIAEVESALSVEAESDTAAFFDRLGKQEPTSRAGRLIGYVSTHPLSAERRQAFVAATRAAPPYRAAMGAEEWQALRTICGPTGTKPGTAGPKPR